MENYDDIIWSTPSSGAPIVTIATYGITFNSSTIDLMNNPKRIEMGYSPKLNKVLIKPSNKSKEEGSFAFASRANKRGYIRIGNKDFVKYIANKSGLPITKESIRFPATWDSKNKILKIDLSNPIDDEYKKFADSINAKLTAATEGKEKLENKSE